MLEQVGLVRRGFDAGRAMQIEVPEPPADAAERIDALLARYEREALARADRLVRFAESRLCRHRQVAEHFGETLPEDCGMCDVCSPLAAAAVEAAATAPLPDDIAGAIHGAVLDLRWPLGRTGLAAMLRGSMSAPRSAQRSPHFGLLAAATQAEVKRWIQLLEVAGALEAFESDDGFRLLRAVPGAELPRIGVAGRRRARPTRGCSSACAPGGSSARGSTRCPPTSSSTTRRSASSRRRSRPPSSISRR